MTLPDHFHRSCFCICDEIPIGLPEITKHHDIDVISFRNDWQIKLIWQPRFQAFFTNYLKEIVPPYRSIIRMGAVTNMTLLEIDGLIDNFLPLILNGGMVVICELQPHLQREFKQSLLDCLIVVKSDLRTAIEFVTAAVG